MYLHLCCTPESINEANIYAQLYTMSGNIFSVKGVSEREKKCFKNIILYLKVNVGNDQEMAQSEKNNHSKN